MKSKYSFRVELWKYDGPSGWCFMTLPQKTSQLIRKKHFASEEGWGRLKAKVTIGKTSWNTSIWFDTKANSYLLPVKNLIRKKEKLAIGSKISTKLEIELDCRAIHF